MKSPANSAPSWMLVPASLLILLVAWEAAVRLSGIDAFLVPSPSKVVMALKELAQDGTLWRNFWVTLVETLAGFAAAAVLGVALGALISEFSWARKVVYPYLVALQTVPKIAIAPMLVIWFGFGITSKVVIAGMVAIFPILVNTIEGLANTEEARVDLLRSLGGNRGQVFWMVKFPSALPFIFAGLGAGVVLSLLGAVVGEFVGARAGLGNLILIVNARLETASVFAILVVLGIIGISLNFVLRTVQSKVVFWTGTQRKRSTRRNNPAAKPARAGSPLAGGAVATTILAAIAVLPMLQPLPADAQERRKLILALAHQSVFPGEEAYAFAVPLQMGYFAEEGLEVTVETSAGGATAVQLVSAGKADIGMASPATVFSAISKNAKIRSIFNLTPRYGTGLAVLGDSVIRKPADLKGKAVGVSSLSSSRVPEVKLMLGAVNLQPDRDTQIIAVGAGGQAAYALTSKMVDGLFLWDNAYFVLEAQGVKLRIIRDVFPEAAQLLDFLAFANEDLVLKEPKVVERFGRAVAKAMSYTVANPDAALEMFYKTFPDARAKNDQQKGVDLYTMRAVAKAIDVSTTGHKMWGYFPPEYVDTTVKLLQRQNELPQGLDQGRLYTNDHAKFFNSFAKTTGK